MHRSTRNPQQQLALPMAPQPPSPGEVDAELVRMWQERPGWRERWPSPAALLNGHSLAPALRTCVRQLLLHRRAAALRPPPTTPT